MNEIERLEINGKVARIVHDEGVSNPRKDFDHAGTMVCWNGRYDLGDAHGFDGPDDLFRELAGPDAERIEAAWERAACRIEYDAPDYLRRCREVNAYFQAKMMEAADKRAVILPLYLYDHSGITMRCSAFACPWDSGQVGYIYMDRDDILREFGGKRVSKRKRERAEALLRSEVEEYDQYLTGDVYGVIVEDEDGEEVDSCWGFYGLDYAKEQAAEMSA